MAAGKPTRPGPGARVLVLEDDVLNAFLMEDTLQFSGHRVIGPARSIAQALTLIATREIEAAILDVQIGESVSFEVGYRLDELGIPWAITTAHAPSVVAPHFPDVPLLSKPFTVTELQDLIAGLLDGRTARGDSGAPPPRPIPPSPRRSP
ncbi:MAG: hypothetical protein WCY29_02760 [Novosphingobium sp.]